jgi:hypothetical protein
MSIVAQKWAWDQIVPNAAAKLLLLALADQADARDGAVRYQDTTARFFSQKCCMSESTFWRCIGSLQVNGFLRRESGKLHGRATEFWLQFNRPEDGVWDNREQDRSVNLTDLPARGSVSVDRPGSVSVDRPGSVSVDRPLIITNQSNQSTTSARARARAGGHAPARSKKPAKEAKDNGLQFVCAGTRHWRALEALYAGRSEPMPKFIYRGYGEHSNHTGRHFRRSELQQALHEVRVTGPPDAGSEADRSAESEPGNHDNARQSATGL